MPTSHRLFVSSDRWTRLRNLPEHPVLTAAREQVASEAESFAADHTLTVDETGHNYHLVRARHAQTRVVTLLVQYGITGERRYRNAALDYVRDMAGWEYWSWIKWREGLSDPDAIFDLSYGENSATLALVYDWLAKELNEEERALLLDTARQRALKPYLARNGTPGEEMWYFRHPSSNWNTVCNGGAGMLALALGELAPESARVLELVEQGIRPYFESLGEDGAWPEGIGYWGYGHRYGYMYLLSHERATGRPHPLLERPGSRNTLRFPFLFSPNGVSAGFGDSNHFFWLPFIYAAAERFQMPDILTEMDRRALSAPTPRRGNWPLDAEVLLLHPGETPATECPWPTLSVQKGVQWGYLADSWPRPALYASVRGGSTDAPHTQQDLTSLNVVVGEELLVENIREDGYLDTTFSDRRGELYEMSAASKNVMLVNGVGLPYPGSVPAQEIRGEGWEGILLDATETALVGSPVHLYGRAVLMLQGQALLVLDRVALDHAALGEVRFHTRTNVHLYGSSARLGGESATLHLAFSGNVPCVLKRGLGMPTDPTREPETVLRWMTAGKHTELVLTTLLTPNTTGRLRLNARKRMLRAAGPGFDVTVRYAEDTLELS